jgi:hypothetical protein
MGFGATITSGESNTPLPAELAQWLVEARVEQDLSKPTRFALRFEDDICGDQPAVAGAPELLPNTVISVIAPAGDQRHCLVRGRITQVKCSTRFGGQGSWVEVHGEDRRVEMDRACVQASWTGLASDAAAQILAAYGFTPDVEATTTVYEENGNTLSQRDTDLGFLEKIASENSMDLWIAYEVAGAPDLMENAVEVTETARLRMSPPQGSSDGGSSPPTLVPSGTPVIRVNVPGDDCPNVTTFNAEVDSERPNAAAGGTVNALDGQVDDAGGASTQAPIDEGASLLQIDGVERSICVASPGDADEQRRRQESALTEAAWFVEATASTTSHMLNGILAPHEVVQVIGAGAQLSGIYQVMEVVHVVNGSDHYMDVKLRSNTLGVI